MPKLFGFNVGGLLAIFSAATILTGCSGGSGEETPPPPEVTVSTPEIRLINDWDEYTGQFDAVEGVEVRARVSGYLRDSHFREGALVRRGQLLFTIDPRPFEAAVARSQADLQATLTRRDLAIADLGRAEFLLEEEAISKEEYDSRVQARQESIASVAAAQANLRQAQLDLEFTRVTSPISGRVGSREVTRGNLVSGSGAQATLLTTVFSLDPIEFIFTADEAAYLKYRRQAREGSRPSSREIANPVMLRLQDEADFVHSGEMSFVDNAIDTQTGTVEGRAIFANPDGIFIPGMFGRLRLLGSGEYNAVLVPDTAILADQSDKVVLIVDDQNIVQQRVVELGPVLEDGMRVIRSGLTRDDRLVTGGLMRARPGNPVTIAGEEPPPEETAKRSAETAELAAAQ
ncbi:efflux RND transporter periplasmic adaptor subunit [Erythrobacter rubeus]|uniref:Efflux RND transporter periplasmic adaptor subunit n=1 Tax=Erythrobacter rubeus TaxID=2760803 RepID=A0ABR8KUI0_9SPHN|nr:efflux RND transporter periplasmic adaptor subunit [Erythrobacter rubeus]MBD2842878.1 efflux RND transporter periplasmic adaptor subunit [Erythrobacter rubeus]